MCHFIRISCSSCHITMKRDPVNCGHGLAVLGPSGLIFECASSNSGDAADSEDVLREAGMCEACEEEKASENENDSNASSPLLSWKRKQSP